MGNGSVSRPQRSRAAVRVHAKQEKLMWEALREAHDEEMERDPTVVVMGENVVQGLSSTCGGCVSGSVWCSSNDQGNRSYIECVKMHQVECCPQVAGNVKLACSCMKYRRRCWTLWRKLQSHI